MKSKLPLFLITSLLSVVLVEVALRLLARRLDIDNNVLMESPFHYDSGIGFELKPHAVLSSRDEHGWRFEDTMNSVGFRGPELPMAKPAGTFRVLALGDAVVEAMNVRVDFTWEHVLSNLLNVSAPAGRTVEVLNAGIGGYVTWQANERLIRYGLRYHPDLVIVMVGWNDFVYATLPIWKPNLELSEITRAYAPMYVEHLKQDRWSRCKRFFSRHSYIWRLLSHAREGLQARPRENRLIDRHQNDSHLPFNEQALKLYEQNLEKIYRTTKAADVPMALLTWPMILSADLLDDPVVHQRILSTYVHFPLSTRELWSGYVRYQEAQRAFAQRHPDVRLIDVSEEWQSLDRTERLRDFVDMAHLTVAGNRHLAETVAPKVKIP